MIRIIRQWESIILCNIQGIMENGMTLCAITFISGSYFHLTYRKKVDK